MIKTSGTHIYITAILLHQTETNREGKSFTRRDTNKAEARRQVNPPGFRGRFRQQLPVSADQCIVEKK